MIVLVADDHPLMRRGMIEFLKATEPAWRVIEAASYEEVEGIASAEAPGLMVVDLNMPGMRGTASLRALRTLAPNTRVIVLTAQDDRNTILECLSAGVHGYLSKSAEPEEIMDALATVVAGGVYVPPVLSELPPGEPPPFLADPDPFPSLPPGAEGVRLSGRQQQVLSLLAEGRSTKDIARELELGIGTVKVHLAAIYRTLGARNRMEAIVKAGVVSRSTH